MRREREQHAKNLRSLFFQLPKKEQKVGHPLYRAAQFLDDEQAAIDRFLEPVGYGTFDD